MQERAFGGAGCMCLRLYKRMGIMGLADRACPAPLCTAGLFAMWMISTTMMGEGSLVLLMHFNKAPGKTRLSVFQWLSSPMSPFRITKEIPYSAPCPRQKTLGLKRHNHYASSILLSDCPSFLLLNNISCYFF